MTPSSALAPHARRLSLAALATIGLAACGPQAGSSDRAPQVASTGQALIMDQAHNAGTQGFYWLPPLVPQPALEGTFAARESPTVRIEALDGSLTPIVFTMTTGPGQERIRVDTVARHYIVHWRTQDFALSTTATYRIHILLGQRVLGLADVQLVAGRSQMRNATRGEYVVLNEGATLPIKWFINTCAPVVCTASDACHMAGSCDVATGACSNPAKPDGASCGDGNDCNGDEICRVGACQTGTPLVCNDGLACTSDACDPSAGCTTANAPDGPFEGSMSTSCGGGACARGGQTVCSTGLIADSCVPGTPAERDATADGLDDDCDGTVDEDVVVAACGDQPCPPDPSAVAPAVDPSLPSSMVDATAFLYSGSQPVQTGVAPGAIDRRRVAVIRGRVLDRDGQGLGGAVVTVLGAPELGRTVSRPDGQYDLAVNGGGQVKLDFQRTGHLPVQREIATPWQDYVLAEDIVMLPLDPQVTTIALGGPSMQVAQGGVSVDSAGARQATVLFPPGVQASLIASNGAITPMSSIAVRATEYTVGPRGPNAMPGTLPPQIAYTYAVELSADEALAAGAVEVRFDRAVHFYLENFLHFPVGGIVPMGYYDRVRGQWVPSANGRVIAIVGITGDMADVDTDGDGLANTGASLVALGLTDGERQQLAGLYLPGQSLWRVPVTHFTPWDTNWPFGPPSDAEPPLNDEDATKDTTEKDPCQNSKAGCIIGVQNQTLGERLPVNGTSLALHYQSDRAEQPAGLDIALSGARIPASLKQIRLNVTIAGRSYERQFAPAANLRHLFVWDGRDAYGRELLGRQPATVQVGFVYDAVYHQPSTLGQAFGALSGMPLVADRARQEIISWQTSSRWIGGWKAQSLGLAGWSLDVHHVYDPVDRMMYMGNGERGGTAHNMRTVSSVAGARCDQWTGPTLGTSGPSSLYITPSILALATGPDGSIYFTNPTHRVYRRAPDGMITTVAGTGVPGFSGDGGPATAARLSRPSYLALGPDGSVYISDVDNVRVRRVRPDGIITTVVGTGAYGSTGDGGPASLARAQPGAIAVAPDGSLYLVDADRRIRRVGPDGVITTAVGNGTYGAAGDGGPATAAQLSQPAGLAFGPDGSLYFTETGTGRIRRVSPNGIITRFGGSNGWGGISGDGGPAVQAEFYLPTALAVDREGGVLVTSRGDSRVRRIGTDGIVTTVAGQMYTYGDSGDGALATATRFEFMNYPIAIGPDGSFYISAACRIRRIGLPSVPVTDDEVAVPAGDVLHVFSAAGRHLRTIDAITGVTRYAFGYDAAGRVTTITDGDGNTTTVERDVAGAPLAIVAPFGQRTVLTLDARGKLSALEDPAGHRHTFEYDPNGLLTAATDPLGHTNRFGYDQVGRFVRDEDAAGGVTTLERIDTNSGFTVTARTALGRATSYTTERLGTDATRRIVIEPSGARTEIVTGTDGVTRTTRPDGTVETFTQGADPRFGMAAPLASSVTIGSPGGRLRTITRQRTVALAASGALTRLTDTVTDNGRASSSTYDAAARTWTEVSAAGRRTVRTLDAQGRVIDVSLPGGLSESYRYDARGRMESEEHRSGSEAQLRSYRYGASGWLEAVTDPLGRPSTFEYDPAGRVSVATTALGGQVRFDHDAAGRLRGITPAGRSLHAIDYTAVGEVSRYLPPAIGPGDQATSFSYDLDGQPTAMTRPDGSAMTMGYNAANGNLVSVTTPEGRRDYVHDAMGRVTQLSTLDGNGIAQQFDGALLTRTTVTGAVAGVVALTYDDNHLRTGLTINGAHALTFARDADNLLIRAGTMSLVRSAATGQIASATLGGVTDTFAQDGFGRPASYTAAYQGAPLFASSYAYDAAGRVATKAETIAGTTVQHRYDYDADGRLSGVHRDGVLVAAYTYDANGNRTVVQDGARREATFDAQDRLESDDGATFAHAASGEQTLRTGPEGWTSYGYDLQGSLRSVTLPNGTTVRYAIDPLGRRVRRSVDGVHTGLLYGGTGLQPLAELSATNQVVSQFVYATQGWVPSAMIRGGRTYRFVTDHLGSVRLVVDVGSGVIAQRLDYDAWGNVTTDTAPGFQPFGFAGGLYDAATGLVRFGARDYDPRTGRWMAKDPIRFAGGDMNLYAYVGNDPVNFIDPTGHSRDGAIQGLIQGLDGKVRCGGGGGMSPWMLLRQLRDQADKDLAAGKITKERYKELQNIYGPVDRYLYARDEVSGVDGFGIGVVGGIADYVVKTVAPGRGRSEASVDAVKWSILGAFATPPK